MIDKIVERMITIEKSEMSEECPISIIDINKWEWAQGVGLYGMYKYAEATGNDTYTDFLKKWYDARIQEGLPEKNVNTCAPMLAMSFLYEKTGNKKYLEYIKEWSAWVYNEMPRTKDGGLQHITTGIENKGQLWADTLYMTVLFLAKAGAILNKQEYIEESKHQFLVHIKYLYDKSAGLFYHGWSFEENNNFSAVHWGRGNCWFTAGIVDYIEIVNADGGLREYLIDTLNSQVEALAKYQSDGGMWHTIIDDESSYEESSATAGFCYGILKGIRKGYIPDKYYDAAMKAVGALKRCVAEDGTVEKCSYGTPVFDSAEKYKNIVCCPMTYGQALVILCLTEAMNNEEKK